jgi:pilus assembly protein FimV
LLAVATLVALALPVAAGALGLGEARVASYLNQPLDVRMRLLETTNDDLDSLTVSPASPADFQRLGMTSDALALDLDVRVDRSQSPPVVRITSDRPVTDPVLQLLIDARWSSGRLLREYTLFLDPATVDVAPPAPPPAAREESEPPPERDEPRRAEPRTEPAPAAAPAAPRAVATEAGRYGPVSSGETLWSIAERNLPAADVTMDQMMIAIVELNPGAFRDANINRLLRGAELRLPDADEARAVDPADAAAAVAAQNRAFRRAVSDAPPVVSDAARDASGDDAATTGGDSGAAAADSPESEPRLSLVPPGEEAGEADDGGSTGDDVDALRQRLARAEEELYAARQEAEEFRGRVAELEALVRDNPGGLGIRDAELAGLEETLRDAREATSADADPGMRAEVSDRLGEYLDRFTAVESGSEGETAAPDAGTGTEPASEVAAAGGGETDPEPAAPVASSDDASAAEAAPVDESAAAAAEQARRDPSGAADRGRDGLLTNPLLWLVAVLVVLLVVVFALRAGLRRRRTAAAGPPRPEPAAEPAEPAEPQRQPVEPEASDADPLQSARQRVADSPADLAAHLALLQALGDARREEEFGAALEAMFERVESGSEPEWREAVELAGRVVPGHALVKGSADWVADDERSADQPRSELDQEREVDELMSRLEVDSDDIDDRDWMPDEGAATEDASPLGPLLREDDDEGRDEPPASPLAGPEEPDVASPEPSAPELSVERDDVARGEPDESEAGDEAPQATEAPDEPDDDVFGRSPEPAGAVDGDALMLDWPEPDEDAPSGPAGEAADEAGEDTTSADADEDIFSQTDDDIDVKLDLARAYVSWNSADSARTLLEEVVREGNDDQRAQAQELLDELGRASGDD